MSNVKKCTACEEIKPLAEFGKSTKAFDGKYSSCKVCVKMYNSSLKAKQAQQRYQSSLKGKLTSYKNSASTRGIPWQLSDEEFMSFAKQTCTYCGSTIPIIGIDRIDSSIGYQMDNCTACCSICNRIKNAYDLDFLNEHLLRMLAYQGIV